LLMFRNRLVKTVNIRSYELRDLSELSIFPKLETLVAKNCRITAITPLDNPVSVPSTSSSSSSSSSTISDSQTSLKCPISDSQSANESLSDASGVLSPTPSFRNHPETRFQMHNNPGLNEKRAQDEIMVEDSGRRRKRQRFPEAECDWEEPNETMKKEDNGKGRGKKIKRETPPKPKAKVKVFSNLTSLDLSCNRLSDLKNLGQFQHLKVLILDHNLHLETLDANELKKLKRLEKLSLCGVSISNMFAAAAALAPLKNLVDLSFHRAGNDSELWTGDRPRLSLEFHARERPVSPSLSSSSTSGLISTLPPRSYRPTGLAGSIQQLIAGWLAESESEDADWQVCSEYGGESDPSNSEFESGRYFTSHSNSLLISNPTHNVNFNITVNAAPVSDNVGTEYYDDDDDEEDQDYVDDTEDTDESDDNVTEGEAEGGGGEEEEAEEEEIEGYQQGGETTEGAEGEEEEDEDEDEEDFNEPRTDGEQDNGSSSDVDHDSSSDSEIEVNADLFMPQIESSTPICSNQHYRAFFIHKLPQLRVLDGRPITEAEREFASETFHRNFEEIPYFLPGVKLSTTKLLAAREIGKLPNTGCTPGKWSDYSSNGYARYAQSLIYQPERATFEVITPRFTHGAAFFPRQFEYHPFLPNKQVIGTVHGDVVIMDTYLNQMLGSISTNHSDYSVLGLCWLKRDWGKFIVGTEGNGYLKLIDARDQLLHGSNSLEMNSANANPRHRLQVVQEFTPFKGLTSVNVNCEDACLITSGSSNDVALYDLQTGQLLDRLCRLHDGSINVSKFANNHPSLFATCSFDARVKLWDLRATAKPVFTRQSRKGNVMVCFSPDDRNLLVSSIDNEIAQVDISSSLQASILEFSTRKLDSRENFTRSYYMNQGDYVISGSCEESTVKIYNAQSGKFFNEITLETPRPEISLLVQSLRADPHFPFQMSVLTHHGRTNRMPGIIKVSLLAHPSSSDDLDDERDWRKKDDRNSGRFAAG